MIGICYWGIVDESYTIERDLEFTQIRVKALEKENQHQV